MHEIVRVVVADGDADVVALDVILFRDPVPHTPAKENPDVISHEPVAAHDGALRAGAGMQAKAIVALTHAILDEHVVANLPTDAVAIVMARRDAADGDPIALQEKDAARVIAIEVLVPGAVAVEDEVFDGDVGDVFTGNNRKQRRDLGAAEPPEILPQTLVEFEPVTGARHERALHGLRLSTATVLRAQANSIADFEAGRIGERDFLVKPIAVLREGCGDGRLLDEDRFGTAAEQAHLRMEVNRVPQPVGARQNSYRAAAEPRHIIHGGLNRLVGDAHDVGLGRADGDGQTLFPRRFNNGIAKRGARGLRRFGHNNGPSGGRGKH